MRASLAIRAMRPDEAADCEAILRALPDWFGIESSILDYRLDIEAMETWVAEMDDCPVGFLTLRTHNPHSAEIQVMAVRREHHRKGIGRALVERAQETLCERSVEFLQVKTLGPSRENRPYAKTREFYRALGFRPLEENRLWGESNPCLIMVTHLGC